MLHTLNYFLYAMLLESACEVEAEIMLGMIIVAWLQPWRFKRAASLMFLYSVFENTIKMCTKLMLFVQLIDPVTEKVNNPYMRFAS